MITIGIISDTHGLLREEVINYLIGCDLILHAGDINKPEVLDRLRQIAPLKVVRGNNDHGEWAEELPLAVNFTIAGKRFYMTHRKKDIPSDLDNVDIIIVGHSHQYCDEVNGMRHLLNPGSCGKRRFGLPITMAKLTIQDEKMHIEQIILTPLSTR